MFDVVLSRSCVSCSCASNDEGILAQGISMARACFNRGVSLFLSLAMMIACKSGDTFVLSVGVFYCIW